MAETPAVPRTPSADLPDRRFVDALFRGLAPRYEQVLLTYSLAQDLRWKQVLVRRLDPRPGELALDIACGTGLIMERLRRVLGGPAVVGMDINRAMLMGSSRSCRLGKVVQADATGLPFRASSFDLVTAGYLLKYVDLEAFFSEVARVLHPGGRFGGYDFSRPVRGTVAGTSYSVYLHRILPFLGHRLGRHHETWRKVFDFLPRVAEASGWELRAADVLERSGFDQVELRPSLGGAVTWVWARRKGDSGGVV